MLSGSPDRSPIATAAHQRLIVFRSTCYPPPGSKKYQKYLHSFNSYSQRGQTQRDTDMIEIIVALIVVVIGLYFVGTLAGWTEHKIGPE